MEIRDAVIELRDTLVVDYLIMERCLVRGMWSSDRPFIRVNKGGYIRFNQFVKATEYERMVVMLNRYEAL